jgi:muramoyltetrapeptide carboxypeptidase
MWRSGVAVHKPAPLRRGGRIGVVAPAGCVNDELLLAGVQALQQEGFQVELAPAVHDRKGYLAGDDEKRACDLDAFFCRPDLDAIFCARGGFGSIQLLPHLTERICSHPKIFAGYSDVTILLNWLLQNCGMVTFHAPMVAMDFARGLTQRSRDHLWGTLTGEKWMWQIAVGEVIRSGKVQAEMLGGCLSVVVTTLGTPYEIDTTGKMLFLEDVGEKPYRVERMLTHLKMAGKFERLAGLVFGDFTQCDGEGPRDIRAIIGELFHKASYPVVMGMPAGHGQENLVLPFGVKLALDGDAGTLSLIESPVA